MKVEKRLSSHNALKFYIEVQLNLKIIVIFSFIHSDFLLCLSIILYGFISIAFSQVFYRLGFVAIIDIMLFNFLIDSMVDMKANDFLFFLYIEIPS